MKGKKQFSVSIPSVSKQSNITRLRLFFELNCTAADIHEEPFFLLIIRKLRIILFFRVLHLFCFDNNNNNIYISRSTIEY